MIWFWTAVGFTAAIYCLATGFISLRKKPNAFGLLGVALGIAMLFMPVVGRTKAVKIDLPAA